MPVTSVKVYLIATLMILVSACTPSAQSGTSSPQISAFLGDQALAVTPATAQQCPNGGEVYSVYLDANQNQQLDPGEQVENVQIVCNGTNGSNGANGANGSNGLNTVFSVNRVAMGLDACSSGHGLEVSFGLDANSNGVLDASELTQTQVLCDGQDGAVGGAGPAGSNGENAVFQLLAADPQVCPAGGSTILMALDSLHLGVYDAQDSSQQSATLCNGQNGLNGSNGINGLTPAYSPVEPIMPCGNTVAYKEVLLRLSGGQVLAAFSDNTSGAMTRLSFLPDGSYVDTDDSGCGFNLSTSSDGTTRSISWFGAVQESWTMSN